MRFIVSAVSLFLFIALFIHGLFMVTGIAPRTVANVNGAIQTLVSNGPSGLDAVSQLDSNEHQPATVFETLHRPVQNTATPSESEYIGSTYLSLNHSEPRSTDSTGEQETMGTVTQAPYEQPSAKNYHPSIGVYDYGDVSRPVRIAISSIGVNADIIIPPASDNETLDEALTHGIVYYPGSGRFGENGNAFLFGHSSWLPIVRNKNFKVFNELTNVREGDLIFIYTTDQTYPYQVVSKRIAGDDEVWVDFADTDRSRLTLSSCNSFGSREQRVVVEAVLVEY